MNKVEVKDTTRADHRFQDGALPHVSGVKSFQILQRRTGLLKRLLLSGRENLTDFR